MFQNYFPLFGGLHIEQSLLVLHGQLIKDFGLMEILNPQKLSVIGLSAVVDVNSIKRATYCIQVTLSTFYIKLNQATALDNLNACPYDWLRQRSAENEMCFFWEMVFDFQVNYLMFIRSQSEVNFRLYILALRKLIK